MGSAEKITSAEPPSLSDQVRSAVFWRSGAQIVAQLVMWASTFLVIRLLEPSDYGLFAMTQVVLALLTLLNGYGFANALIRAESVGKREIGQAFGLLILLNGSLALLQILLAPVAAAYFRQPIVADLLQVQALLYVATPFAALNSAQLSRRMDFKRQAQVQLTASLAGAATALACAYSGMGVWTLVFAALVYFWTQAAGMTIAAGNLVAPIFRFRGAGPMVRYGSAMIAVQFFWFVQSQADVFIAGRVLSPHALGLYTTALFLTQILASKFVPALNDIAFAAYSRIQGRPDDLAFAFLKAVRLIMLVALPFYFGLAVTAQEVVLTVMGPKWGEAAPLAAVLALAMPFVTLQILFTPATNAIGRADIALKIGAAGALLMPLSFLVGIQFGVIGLTWAWLIVFPLFTAATMALALPVIGVRLPDLARAIWPGLAAAAVMATAVHLIGTALPPLATETRLAIMVGSGIIAYAAVLLLIARPVVLEGVNLLLRRRPALQAP